MFQMKRKSKEPLFSNAQNYQEWQAQAQAYDVDQGLERWKKIDQTASYDYVLVRSRIDKIRRMRIDRNNPGLLFALKEGLHGNLGGMGNEALYNKAKSGTKNLVEEYITEVCEALEYIASSEVDDISFATKLDFFNRIEESFGHSALMLSGSGSLLYFHIGVVLELVEQNLVPKVISGSSGGAFIGSMLCTHTNEELKDIFNLDNFIDEELIAEKERNETKEKKSLFSFLKFSGASTSDFENSLERLIPDMTFQEALEKTGRHLNVSVASAEYTKSSRLLNAKTSPNVFLRESIRASAAAPGLFKPAMLAARNEHGEKQDYLPNQKWVDGSLNSDLPVKRLSRLYGANHFIVSQTNPHVIPFVTDAKRKRDTLSVLKYASFDTTRTWINASASIWKRPLASSEKLTKVSHILLSIINQNYKGDINIIPPRKYFNPLKQLSWMSRQDMQDLIDAGRRSTWPKVEMIRLQSKISRTLEKIMREYYNEVLEQSGEPNYKAS